MNETSEASNARTVEDGWLAQVVLDLGRPAFHVSLLRGLSDIVGADHISHLSFNQDGRIWHAGASSLSDQSMIDWTTDVYVSGMYLRDPNYALVCATTRQPTDAEGVRMVALSPDSIRDSEYRRLLFEKPGFESKVSLMSAWGGSTCYLNLYFSEAGQGGPLQLLRTYAPLLMSLAHRHDDLARGEEQPPTAEMALHGLSLRERQVADLLRMGRTAKEVGRLLGLSPTTVVTYKARIFEKVHVANLKEFLLKSPSAPAPLL
jgi:DNA-binding CsgD family transcriptional regulator